ncbi:restriction endonuclease [Vibrio cholerae]
MIRTKYPIEHELFLRCDPSGDFYSQAKKYLQLTNENIVREIVEDISILCDKISNKYAKGSPLISLDPSTLNYVLDSDFLLRYRSVNSFITSINPTDFEYLCAYYLNLLGCLQFEVTRQSSDQGLDFYGVLPFEKHSYFGPTSEKSFLIGQAKLYTNKVSTNEIREFYGSIELLRRRIYSKEIYSYRFATELKSFSLINPIFISSTTFTEDAAELCNKIGIRMVDIVKLNSLLSTVEKAFASNVLIESEIRKDLERISLAQSN